MIWGLVIAAISFIYRWIGITNNTPFWVDEFSSAQQGLTFIRLLDSGITPAGIELNNILSNSIISSSLYVFGIHEWSARLPFVIIGSLVPLSIYVIANKFFSKTVAISSGLLAALSYFLIVWSRQARGYALQQLLTILILYLYLRLIKGPTSIIFKLMTAGVVVLGLLTHAVFGIVLVSIIIHYLLFNRQNLKKLYKSPYFYLVLGMWAALFFKFGYLNVIKDVIVANIAKTNNLWYYHSFLWREYGLVAFLGIAGLLTSVKKSRAPISLFLIFIFFQLVFVSFLWAPYTSRYLLTIFPFLFIGVALTLERLLKNPVWVFVATLLIVGNGYKFVVKPKQYYSINHDFREISNIDYGQVYELIKSKGDLDKNQTAVIDTWHDRLHWYLGMSFPNGYLFRWMDEPGLINGLPKHTNYKINRKGEKYIADSKNLLFIGELRDLKIAMKKYPKGFIFIDDSSLPKDVIDYVRQNFKKELYLDHYALDDNPYSIWPATLYSWGIK